MKKNGHDYVTRGWSLPITNIKNVDGKLFVDGFMSHLNGLEILAITEEAYNENQNP